MLTHTTKHVEPRRDHHVTENGRNHADAETFSAPNHPAHLRIDPVDKATI
jgi:hypothetical protein